jgi:hypothetical protein
MERIYAALSALVTAAPATATIAAAAAAVSIAIAGFAPDQR